MDRTIFDRLMGPIKRKLYGMASRAVVKLITDSTKMQELQLSLLDSELAHGVERFQNYGFTSHPQAGAEAVMLCLGADRAHGVAIVVDDRRYRLKSLVAGEVAIYTDEGDYIHLKRGNTVAVSTLHLEVQATDDINMNTKTCTINASDSMVISTTNFTTTASAGTSFVTPALTSGGASGGGTASFGGSINAAGDIVAGSISLQSHTHPENNDTTTGAPN